MLSTDVRTVKSSKKKRRDVADKKKKNAPMPTVPVSSGAAPADASLKIDWHVGEQIVARYATHLVVQCLEQECYISFFEITPPMAIVGISPEEVPQKIKEVGLRAECVSRVIVPLNKIPEFWEAIKGAYDKRTSLGKPPGSGEEVAP